MGDKYNQDFLYRIDKQGFYYSTNDGEDWFYDISGLDKFDDINSNLFKSKSHLFVSTNNGIFKSSKLIEDIKKETQKIVNNKAVHLEPTNGPYGGSVNKIFKIGKNTIIIKDGENDLFISYDNGLNWQELQLNINKFSRSWINKKGTIYVDDREDIKMSNDLGKSWKYIDKKDFNININNVVFDLKDQAYFSSENGIYTIDTSLNKFINIGFSRDRIDNIFISKDNIFAFTNGILFRSSDKGKNWKKLLLNTKGIESVLIAPNNNIYIYHDNKTFISKNLGDTWQTTKQIFNLNTYTFDSSNQIIALDKDSNSIFSSKDNGNTWKSYYSSNNNLTFNDIVITDNGKLLGASYNGIFTFDNQLKSFVLSSTGLNNLEVKNVSVNDKKITADNYISNNQGKIWNKIDLPLDENETRESSQILNSGTPLEDLKNLYIEKGFSKAKNSLGHIFIATDHGIMRSTNRGNYWVQNSMLFPTYFVSVNKKDEITAFTNQGIFKSLDGKKWDILNSNFKFSEKTKILNLSDNLFIVKNGLYKFDLLTNEIKLIAFPNTNIYSCNIDKKGRIIVSTGKTFYSENEGLSWSSIEPTKNVHTYSFDLDEYGYLFIGTDKGVFKSNLPLN